MLIEFIIFTAIATASTIMPVYKVRQFLGWVFTIPIIGFIIIMGYGFVVSWLLLNLFSFKSSVAGLGNLASSIVFTAYIAYVAKFPNKRNNITSKTYLGKLPLIKRFMKVGES